MTRQAISSAQIDAFIRRGLALLVVFAAGLIGFLSGVSVTQRPGLADAEILAKIYYTLALFVLGGLDLGTPTGDPLWGRWLLWFAYFGAPLLTASALTEALLRAINPDRWRFRGLRNHIVIGGSSRLAMLYLRRLRALGNRDTVIIIDERTDHPNRVVAHSHRARWLTGNMTRDSVIDALALERAKRVLLLTGDDFANLNAASKMLARAPALEGRIIAHVGDLRFKQLMTKDSRAGVDVVNTYQIAAVELVETTLLPFFKKTEFRDIVVFFGFGRLGQTILAEVQRRAPHSIDSIVIVDVFANDRVLDFADQVGFLDSYSRSVIQGDASSLNTWAQVEALHDFDKRGPAFLLISGDDALNLRIALRLSKRHVNAKTVVRTYYRSPFAENASKRVGFSSFSVADLIHDSLPTEWFT